MYSQYGFVGVPLHTARIACWFSTATTHWSNFCTRDGIDSQTVLRTIRESKKHSFMHSQTIQTGISDFHKMTLTQIKLTYNKLPPKTITYRDFKSFNKDAFEEELKFALQAANIQPTYANFLSISSRTLDNHVLIKKRKVRGNQVPFMNKALRKTIMRRSNLLNKFVNNRKLGKLS